MILRLTRSKPMPWAEDVLTHLSTQGHRVTEQLFKDLGGDTGPIGRATVYRTVDLLLNDHWLARVHWSAAKETTSDDHAYVPVEQGHQHHLVCRNCGAVAAFEGCDIDGLLGGLARRLNFRVEGHSLEIYGMCQVCQRQM